MDLNQLIYYRLIGSKDLSARLASYHEEPAIFPAQFPSDQQPGWEGKSQYPRLSYRIDMQVNQERASVGNLHVSVFTQDRLKEIEEIEDIVKGCLKDVLMRPSEQAPFCVAWARTEPYLFEGLGVIGKDILFDILEYSAQQTTDPDPVMAMNVFVKDLFPEAVVLGMDRITDYTNPADRPVFFCRLEDITSTTGHCMNTIAWFNCKMAVHLLCPDSGVRGKMIAAINRKLGVAQEVIMLDQSPMTIKSSRMNNKADYLREGQLEITGKYGCLRGGEKKHNVSYIISSF